MAERARHSWRYRLLFLALVAAVAFVQLLPLGIGPGRIPGPDVMLLIAFSWIVMRPDYLPILLLAAVFLVADLILMRPPGLWTALAVMGGEFLRGRTILFRDASFPVEWLLVGLVIMAMTLANAAVLGIFGIAQPSFGLTLIRLIFTVLAYPVVVILAGRAFGIRKQRVGEQDRPGQRS